MDDEINFRAFEGRKLTPEEWQRLTQRIIARARAARARDLRAALGWIVTASRAAAMAMSDLARRWWHACAIRRARRAAIRELQALDDRSLRDIGLGRSEIESVVHDPERALARSLAAARHRAPAPRPEFAPAPNLPLQIRAAGDGFRRAALVRADARRPGQRGYSTVSSKVARKGCAG